MATYTPPPYFPQGSLAPPDKSRYRKFKIVMALVGLLVVGLIAGAGYLLWHLFSRAFF